MSGVFGGDFITHAEGENLVVRDATGFEIGRCPEPDPAIVLIGQSSDGRTVSVAPTGVANVRNATELAAQVRSSHRLTCWR